MNLIEQLASLVKRSAIYPYEAEVAELKAHIDSAGKYLSDAKNAGNSNITRFMVANSAGHQLLTAALKMEGYRTSADKGHRALLYDILDGLLPGASDAKETLSRAHNTRNKADYEGDAFEPTDGLIEDMVEAVESVKEEVDFNFKKFKAQREEEKKAAQQPNGLGGNAVVDTAKHKHGASNRTKKKP